MFIAPAYAQAGGAPGGFDLISLMPLLLIFVVFYFLLIRPQQKKVKQHREMLSNIRRGDRVLTGGGIFGTVTKVVNDTELVVQIAEAVKVRIARGTITEVLSKTEPVKAEKSDKAEKGEKAEKSSGDVAAG